MHNNRIQLRMLELRHERWVNLLLSIVSLPRVRLDSRCLSSVEGGEAVIMCSHFYSRKSTRAISALLNDGKQILEDLRGLNCCRKDAAVFVANILPLFAETFPDKHIVHLHSRTTLRTVSYRRFLRVQLYEKCLVIFYVLTIAITFR